ncbi:MAG: hypothetical protein MI861_05035 [Pirellulales bacterium]|nr:hypothetical protein [Pirellulales bacterium]
MTVDRNDSVDASQSHPGKPAWLPAALLSLAGALIGTGSLTLFCVAMGVNLREEGWARGQPVHQPALVISIVGFVMATLMFWLGIVRVTRHVS